MNKTIQVEDPELQRLIEAHPLLFRGKELDVYSYVVPGWYEILDQLCFDIEATLGSACTQFRVRQIKEKFGTLRFYYRLGRRKEMHVDVVSPEGREHSVARSVGATAPDSMETRVRELVAAACTASESLCERCAAAAQLRNLGGYLTTLCDRHLADAAAKRSQGIS